MKKKGGFRIGAGRKKLAGRLRRHGVQINLNAAELASLDEVAMRLNCADRSSCVRKLIEKN